MAAAVRSFACLALLSAACSTWFSNESLASDTGQQKTDAIASESQQRLARYRETEDNLSSLRREFRQKTDNFDNEFQSQEQAITWARGLRSRAIAIRSRINSYGSNGYNSSARDEHLATIAAMVSEMDGLIDVWEKIQQRTLRRGFVISHRKPDGRVSGSCGDGALFSAILDGVYQSMPYGACAARKGCESGATIEEAIRKACRE